jgi:hypothetical protein
MSVGIHEIGLLWFLPLPNGYPFVSSARPLPTDATNRLTARLANVLTIHETVVNGCQQIRTNRQWELERQRLLSVGGVRTRNNKRLTGRRPAQGRPLDRFGQAASVFATMAFVSAARWRGPGVAKTRHEPPGRKSSKKSHPHSITRTGAGEQRGRRGGSVQLPTTVGEGSSVNFLRSQNVITEQEISRDSRRDEA